MKLNSFNREQASEGTESTRSFIYEDVTLEKITMYDPYCLELWCQFRQPPAVRGLRSLKSRREWWIDSKRLQQDAFVCLINANGVPIYCKVFANGLDEQKAHVHHRKKANSVFHTQGRGHVTLSILHESQVCRKISPYSVALKNTVHAINRNFWTCREPGPFPVASSKLHCSSNKNNPLENTS